jgi:hypothetical protein
LSGRKKLTGEEEKYYAYLVGDGRTGVGRNVPDVGKDEISPKTGRTQLATTSMT